ncbi:hypothetical protein [Cupriavidus sp. TMH.W2]|uniref:hypothetical protein n=1 Tax=Cupriavidus sp. TMH.W2 TaxID=3434465 RepID=UPI003D770E2B
MVQISNAEYATLIGERDALKAKAAMFCDVVEAFLRSGEEGVPKSLQKVDESRVADELYALRALTV